MHLCPFISLASGCQKHKHNQGKAIKTGCFKMHEKFGVTLITVRTFYYPLFSAILLCKFANIGIIGLDQIKVRVEMMAFH